MLIGDRVVRVREDEDLRHRPLHLRASALPASVSTTTISRSSATARAFRRRSSAFDDSADPSAKHSIIDWSSPTMAAPPSVRRDEGLAWPVRWAGRAVVA